LRIAIDLITASHHTKTEKRITEKFNTCLKSRDKELNAMQTTLKTVVTDMKRVQEVIEALQTRVNADEVKATTAGLGQVEALQEERDTAVEQRDAMEQERDTAMEQRDDAVEQRDEAVQQRDAMERERDEALQQYAAMEEEHDEAVEERDTLQEKLDEAVEERDALQEERDALQEKLDRYKAWFIKMKSFDMPEDDPVAGMGGDSLGKHHKRPRTKIERPSDLNKRIDSAREYLQGILKESHDGDVIFVTDLIKELRKGKGVGKIHRDHVHRLMRDIFGVEASEEMPAPPKPQREQKAFRGFKFMDAHERAQWQKSH
jgi:DNA repair exonuclease SbcCD ATPase subunit